MGGTKKKKPARNTGVIYLYYLISFRTYTDPVTFVLMCPLHFSENMKLKEMNAVLYLMQ